MIAKKHYNKINEPIRISLLVFEINFIELAIMSLSLFLIMVLCGVVNVYVNIFGVWFFLTLLALYVPLLCLLSFANKQDHPQFLLSWLSLKLQPKRITFIKPTLFGI